MKSVEYRAARDMLRRCAGQSHFCIHSGVASVRWEGNLQKTLFPPIELVEAREGGTEGVRQVIRVIQRDKYMGRG
jgi:hypothetical protein